MSPGKGVRYGDSGPPAKHDSLLQHDTITINQNNKYSRALLEDDKELKKKWAKRREGKKAVYVSGGTGEEGLSILKLEEEMRKRAAFV